MRPSNRNKEFPVPKDTAVGLPCGSIFVILDAMKLVMSPTMGYCKGVSRALDMAWGAIEDARKTGLPVYSLGKLIHNKQVCNHFAQAGMIEIAGPEGHERGVVVLRAHGVGDKLRSDFLDAGYQIVDATCPVVKRNLLHIARYAVTHTILVVGHYKHPESTAMQEVLLDGKPITSRLITTLEDVGEPGEGVSYAVFVQTTFDQNLWMQIQAALTSWQQKGIEVVFANDVCPSSVNRRTALSELAGQCDAVLVIGGKDSANTKALYSMVLEMGRKAWHIEEAAEITNEMRQCAILGITAGASTPASLVESIVDALQQE